ncbi:MAG: T9SS type A sorting domain-containing protein, partial [Bacteroidales bacterium]
SNPLGQATFYYVDGFEITDADFTSSVKNNPANNLAVSQNYPNPFNGATSIDVTMQKAGNLSLLVHNLMGQVVHSNDLGFVSAGNHTIQISAELSTGIYTYTVQAGDASVTRKMSVK